MFSGEQLQSRLERGDFENTVWPTEGFSLRLTLDIQDTDTHTHSTLAPLHNGTLRIEWWTLFI